jgi:hypothetical protein
MDENHTNDYAFLRILATYIKHRREDAELGMREAAVLADVSPSTWNNVEQGRPVRGRTYARVERGLQLPPGTCRRIASTGITAAPTSAAVSPGAERIANMIEITQNLPDVPKADRAAITAAMTAALVHMQSRPDYTEATG